MKLMIFYFSLGVITALLMFLSSEPPRERGKTDRQRGRKVLFLVLVIVVSVFEYYNIMLSEVNTTQTELAVKRSSTQP